MQESHELGAVALVGDQRVGLEHSFETLAGVAGLVADLGSTSSAQPRQP